MAIERLANAKGVEPQHQIAAGYEYPRDLEMTLRDEAGAHRRQHGATFLACAFVSVLQLVEHGAMLRIEENQRRAAIR